MGQKFAAYGANGAINGFYDSVDSPLPDGVTAIEITDSEWQECLSVQGYTVQGGALVAPVPITAAQQLAQLQTQLCAQIDATADQVYIAIGGPSPGRLAEYQQAGADAASYKAAGYTGTVPATVACWVTASGMDAKDAADNIIATAAQWVGALEAIRAGRLIGKASVTKAADVASAQAAADAAIANVQAVASAA